MRNVSNEEEGKLKRLIEAAVERRFPKMSIDIRGDGYIMSWGPGAGPWLDVVYALEPADLDRVLTEVRKLPAPILYGFEDAGPYLASTLEQSARFWAEVRYNAGQHRDTYDAVMIAGAHVVIEQVLKQFNLAAVMANAWEREYRRQVSRVNAEREQRQDGSPEVHAHTDYWN